MGSLGTPFYVYNQEGFVVVRCHFLVVLVILFSPVAAFGQSKVDPFDFLEEWDLLSQDYRNGKLELTIQGLPIGYDTEPNKVSEDGHFDVSIEPKDGKMPLNEIHTWLVELKTPEGAPISEADISFFGAMPLHNHGLPTEPRIVGEVDPGVYVLEGVKFSMAGWWTIGMGIVAADKTDRVSFNLMYEP